MAPVSALGQSACPHIVRRRRRKTIRTRAVSAPAWPAAVQHAVRTRDRRSARLKRLLVLSGGGSHSWRAIYMDGRPHPTGDDVNPTYYGHSVGHWEKETLVVDTVGFNERFWMAGRPGDGAHRSSPPDRTYLAARLQHAALRSDD